MIRLVLLGTVHRDPSGKRKLTAAIENIRPSAISLEVSPASVRLRKESGREWMILFKKRLGLLAREMGRSPGELMGLASLRGVFEYIRLPYEYRAALEFADRNGAPMFLLDESKTAEDFLGRVKSEILTRANMALLAHHDDGATLDQDVRAQYIRARTMVLRHKPGPAPLVRDLEEWKKRETALAQKLRLLHQGLARRAGRTMSGAELAAGLVIAPEAVGLLPLTVTFPLEPVHLYIGGWEHLTETEEQLDMYSHLRDLSPEKRLCPWNAD
ncbi:MAG: hypothetical protein V1816_10310 [Pseudomonadota bacterium]